MSALRDPAYDVAVVGLGGMGSAVAAHAARRGLRVVGLERFTPAHAFGASTGRSRIIRKAYFEDPAYVPLLLRAYDLWRDLEAETGLDVLRVTGMLMIGAPESATLAGAHASAALHGLPLEELSIARAAERFPMVKLRAGEVALLETDAGFVRPEAAIDAHLRVARDRGAELRFETPVERWEARDAERVEIVLADGRRMVARSLVACVGPWFVDRPEILGVPLRVQRNVQAWFRPASDAFALGKLPVFFIDRPDYPKHLYGFPDSGDGVKAAFHGLGETTAPDALRRGVDADEIEEIRRALDDALPGAGGAFASAKACMYSLTPDEHFVVSRSPSAPNVIVAGGFSGHGFKFCSVIGEVVTDLVERGASRHDIAFLSPSRFARAT